MLCGEGELAGEFCGFMLLSLLWLSGFLQKYQVNVS